MSSWPTATELGHLAFEAENQTAFRREVMRRLILATNSEMALFANAVDMIRAKHVVGMDARDADAARHTVMAHPHELRRANEQLFERGVMVDTLIYTPREWRGLPHVEEHQVRMRITSNIVMSWHRPGASPVMLNLCRTGALYSQQDEQNALGHLRAIAIADAWHSDVAAVPTLIEPPNLTDRQREILSYVRCGLTNREIAKACHLSPFTVRNHLVKLFERFGVASRTELAMTASQAGMRDS